MSLFMLVSRFFFSSIESDGMELDKQAFGIRDIEKAKVAQKLEFSRCRGPFFVISSGPTLGSFSCVRMTWRKA